MGAPLTPSQAAVLAALRRQTAPVTVHSLARLVGLHPNTVREHLEALLRLELTCRQAETPQGRGRPAWLYEATDPTSEAVPGEHVGLTAALARALNRIAPHPRQAAIATGREWGREIVLGDRVRRQDEAGTRDARGGRRSSVVEARRRVFALLGQLGFAPTTDPEQESDLLLTRCPVLDSARAESSVVCSTHLGMIQGVLSELGVDGSATTVHPFESSHCRVALRVTELGDGDAGTAFGETAGGAVLEDD